MKQRLVFAKKEFLKHVNEGLVKRFMAAVKGAFFL